MNKLHFFGLAILLSLFAKTGYSQISDTASFDELFTLVLENNFGLQMARNDAEIDRITNTSGKAGFIPSAIIAAGASTSISNSKQEFRDGTLYEINNSNDNSTSALVEVNWTLFDGTRMFVTKQRLNEIERQGAIALQIQIERVYIDLASKYYRLIQEQKLAEVLQYNLLISKERYNLAAKKYSLGAASQLDVIQAQLDRSADSTAMISERAAIENLKAEINQLLGRSPAIPVFPKDEIQTGREFDFMHLSNLLDQQNNELNYARSNEYIQRLAMKESATEFSPVVSTYGNYNYYNSQSEAGQFASNINSGPTVGLRISYNLFDGFNKRTDYQVNRIEYETAQLQTHQASINVQTELYKSFTIYQSALQTVAIEKINRQEAQRNIDIAIELYKRGQLNEIDFREIQRKIVETENSLLAAEYLAKISELNLLRLTSQLPL